jgi:hypothetical protein
VAGIASSLKALTHPADINGDYPFVQGLTTLGLVCLCTKTAAKFCNESVGFDC